MVELLQKVLKQPEPNAVLYNFAEDALLHLDKANDAVVANFPLFFALHLTTFFGFRINDNYSEQNNILDLHEGYFVHEIPLHAHYLDGDLSFTTYQLLKVRQPYELEHIRLRQEFRRSLLKAYQDYYGLHIQDFGTMKTLPVLQEVLG
jgi:DNA repair protein RecO (recombination protein O)